MNSATHSQASTNDARRAVHGTVGPLVGHLFPGDVLIPQGNYRYCIRIDKLCPIKYRGWDGRMYEHEPAGSQQVCCTRYDLSEAGEPVYEHGDPLFCFDLYPVTDDVFRDPHGQGWGEVGLPQYFQKWKPRSGQLCLF